MFEFGKEKIILRICLHIDERKKIPYVKKKKKKSSYFFAL